MNILIIGASSGLGMNISKFYSNIDNNNLICTSSDLDELKRVQQDIYSRYQKKIKIFKCDFSSKLEILKFIRFLNTTFKKKIDLIYYCSGINYDSQNLDINLMKFEEMLKINFLGFHNLISIIYKNININYLKSQIIFISSISTIRIRKKNFLYSTSKKVSEYYIKGMNIHLNKFGINILTVHMGFLDTKLGNSVSSLLKMDPYKASKIIHFSLKKKKESIYIPSYWYLLRYLILIIPNKIWNDFKI